MLNFLTKKKKNVEFHDPKKRKNVGFGEKKKEFRVLFHFVYVNRKISYFDLYF